MATGRDIILVAVLIFALGTGLFVLAFMINTTIDSMQAIGPIAESQNAVDALEGAQNLTSRYDYIVFSVFIGFFISIILLSWFVAGNPLFMIIYFFGVIVITAGSMIFANVWEDLSQASVFGNLVASFPLTNQILLNLPVYMAILGGLGLVVMFAKPYALGGN